MTGACGIAGPGGGGSWRPTCVRTGGGWICTARACFPSAFGLGLVWTLPRCASRSPSGVPGQPRLQSPLQLWFAACSSFLAPRGFLQSPATHVSTFLGILHQEASRRLAHRSVGKGRLLCFFRDLKACLVPVLLVSFPEALSVCAQRVSAREPSHRELI